MIIPVVDIGVDVYGERVELPLVGAGTWQYNDTIAYQSVCQALEAGYTLIDTVRPLDTAIKRVWAWPFEIVFMGKEKICLS